MSEEQPLAGGDVNVGENVVVRVGETVRRPIGAHTPAVHALLRHFEAAGVTGVPRVLGFDDKGREVLTYLEGRAASAPVPAADAFVFEVGAFLRRLHDAQATFRPRPDLRWQRMVGSPSTGEVVCHNDLFWPNLIADGETLVGLVDWDLAAPAPRLHDLASAANFWVALRPDDQCTAWGIPVDRRGERLQILCDGYGLPRADRGGLLAAAADKTAIGIETYRLWGRDERRPGWAEMWDRDGEVFLTARSEWLRVHRAALARWLS